MQPAYNTMPYGSDPAMNAAQRWNAMNCSFMGYQPVASTSNPSASTPYYAASGPRFPGRSKHILCQYNVLDYQQTPNGSTYSVYPGPKPQASSQPTTESPSKLTDLGGGKELWSPELKYVLASMAHLDYFIRNYVTRAFCTLENDIEKDQMERILKEKIDYILKNKITIDWTKEPIPNIPSKSIAAIQAAAANKSSIK